MESAENNNNKPPQPQHYRGPVLIMHPRQQRQEIFFGPALGFELVTAEDSGIDSDSEGRSRMFMNHGFDMDADENPNKSDSDAQSDGDGDEAGDSPPLLEVELTASEAEDSGSVLELVIPMQAKKGQYRRVPKDERGERKKPLFRRRPFGWMSCCLIPFKKRW